MYLNGRKFSFNVLITIPQKQKHLTIFYLTVNWNVPAAIMQAVSGTLTLSSFVKQNFDFH